MSEEYSLREKGRALWAVMTFRPVLTVAIIGFSVFAAILEGIGLSFLLPILQQTRADGPPANPDGVMGVFVSVYDVLGVPFTLGFITLGVAVVMTIRFTSSFVVSWARAVLRTTYTRHLRLESFENALGANVSYFDESGSDDILNVIVTQTDYAARLIEFLVKVIEQGLLSVMYLVVAFVMAPLLTVVSIALLGGAAVVIRVFFESGYSVGDRIAEANERVQETAQAGTQGIRDVKLFNLTDDLVGEFRESIEQFTDSTIRFRRNQAAIRNFYQLSTALVLFLLIFVALHFFSLSLERLGVFLFAMFRLAPRASGLNNQVYRVQGDLPHLIRTQAFTDDLEESREVDEGEATPPKPLDDITFEGVSFSYESSDEQVLDDVSFDVEHGEFVAFVGPSGAGKSTVISLLARMYRPDSGEITASGRPIKEYDLEAYRDRLAVVRQHPFVFNDTLRYNVTIARPNASQAEIERACEIAQVTEFLDDLPEEYDTVLGDDGVRLSGGQRQRIALARALLKDADVLLLDEATSDLDSGIEEDVHSGIESLEGEKTLFIVAHRLSTVRNADRIYTMVDGEITEVGGHEELLDADGTYADLFRMQSTEAGEPRADD